MTLPTAAAQDRVAPRRRRQTLRGTVVSDKMNKTIVVVVGRTARHSRYRKVLRLHKKYHAHDEANEARVGDLVEIMATRPLSRQKRWRLVRILERARETGPELAAEPLVAAAGEART